MMKREEIEKALERYETYADGALTREDLVEWLARFPLESIDVGSENHIRVVATRPLKGSEGANLALMCINIEYERDDQVHFLLYW